MHFTRPHLIKHLKGILGALKGFGQMQMAFSSFFLRTLGRCNCISKALQRPLKDWRVGDALGSSIFGVPFPQFNENMSVAHTTLIYLT